MRFDEEPPYFMPSVLEDNYTSLLHYSCCSALFSLVTLTVTIFSYNLISIILYAGRVPVNTTESCFSYVGVNLEVVTVL